MHPIIYDVAVSLDGYIAGPSGDISKFTFEGPVVEDYQSRMAEYCVAIMGKATYEFGYRYGLKPGANPYDHMQTKVISKTLVCSSDCEIEVVRDLNMDIITRMKMTAKGPIYLCGGGDLAGQLLGMGAIDELRLKRSPIVLGGGVSLFGQNSCADSFKCLGVKAYDSGHILEQLST